MKKTKLLSILIIAIMLLLVISPIVSNATESVTITFGDELLAKNVEESLKSQQISVYRNGTKLTLRDKDIETTTILNAGTDIRGNEHIKSLSGLEYFKNLEELNIFNGEYTDLTPILGLKKLTKLYMSGSTKIPSIEPIGELTSLKELAIANCNLKTLKGLEKLNNLEILFIGITNNVPSSSAQNHIEDFSAIQKLPLKQLNIENAKYIENLDFLKNIKSLEAIYAENCGLKDISAIKELGNLKTFRGDGNHIESVEGINTSKIDTFWVPAQTIKRFVKLSDYNTDTIEVDLPQIFTAMVTKGSNINQENSSLTPTNCTISSDNKKISAKKSDIKSESVEVKVEGDNTGTGARGCTVTYYEALEVLNVKKEPETENAEKVKVTITVNKELDDTKIPNGWKLSDDKKSISKEFDKNGREDVTLTDKDGSTVTQNIVVSNIKDENEKPEPTNPDLGKLEIKKTEDEQDNGKVKVTLTANKELDPNKVPKGWELSEDGKSISKVMDKGSEEKITIVAKDGTSLDYTVKVGGKDESNEGFKVTGTDNEKQDNGKVKVTIKVNKELDPNKIPEGWKLSDDGKSIWKIMDQGKEEKVTLVAKDGSTIEYTVKAKTFDTDDKKDNSQAPTDIPQTGVRNVVIGVVAVIIIAGTVVFVRQRNMLK